MSIFNSINIYYKNLFQLYIKNPKIKLKISYIKDLIEKNKIFNKYNYILGHKIIILFSLQVISHLMHFSQYNK